MLPTHVTDFLTAAGFTHSTGHDHDVWQLILPNKQWMMEIAGPYPGEDAPNELNIMLAGYGDNPPPQDDPCPETYYNIGGPGITLRF